MSKMFSLRSSARSCSHQNSYGRRFSPRMLIHWASSFGWRCNGSFQGERWSTYSPTGGRPGCSGGADRPIATAGSGEPGRGPGAHLMLALEASEPGGRFEDSPGVVPGRLAGFALGKDEVRIVWLR